jgi:alkylated DNA nucleotide flippase Atl1
MGRSVRGRPTLRLLALLLIVWVSACGGGDDPRTVEGALARAASALAQDDPAALFRVIDQRARHALAAIVQARREAAQVVRKSYPAAEQPRALAELGDAQDAADAAALFALRCPASCRGELAAKVGAPAETRQEGAITVVRTARDSELQLYRGSDTWYGIVWQTDALVRERDRAAAELELVQKNAELYGKQQALEGPSP